MSDASVYDFHAATASPTCDTFVFRAAESSVDNVSAFERWDKVKLIGFGYANQAAAESHLTQASSDTGRFTDQGTSVTFHAATLAELHTATWLFV